MVHGSRHARFDCFQTRESSRSKSIWPEGESDYVGFILFLSIFLVRDACSYIIMLLFR